MRKVGISIAILQLKYGDEEALRIAKRIGADAVDFNLCDNDRKNPNDIYSKDDDAILEYYRHLKQVADEIGLEICQTHGRLQGFKDIPEEDAREAALILLPQAKEVARSYELTDDFAATPQYERLYTELTGTVQILLDNGVQ